MCFSVSVSRTLVAQPCSTIPAFALFPSARPLVGLRDRLRTRLRRDRLFLLFTRLRRLLDLNALHERPVLQKVCRRRQRTRMGVHLEPFEIGGARVVGVRCRYLELKDDVPLDPLRDELGDGPRHVDDGRKRRALSAARSRCNHRGHRAHRGNTEPRSKRILCVLCSAKTASVSSVVKDAHRM